MFAGGEDIVRVLTPAKPRWSEVMIFWYLLLRQSSPSQEETVSSDKRVVHRAIDCAMEINSGERMLAGGEGVVRGLTPAKPRWSEVIVFLNTVLRQSVHSQNVIEKQSNLFCESEISLERLHIIIRPPSFMMKARIECGDTAADSANIINGSRDQDDRYDERD